MGAWSHYATCHQCVTCTERLVKYHSNSSRGQHGTMWQPADILPVQQQWRWRHHPKWTNLKRGPSKSPESSPEIFQRTNRRIAQIEFIVRLEWNDHFCFIQNWNEALHTNSQCKGVLHDTNNGAYSRSWSSGLSNTSERALFSFLFFSSFFSFNHGQTLTSWNNTSQVQVTLVVPHWYILS